MLLFHALFCYLFMRAIIRDLNATWNPYQDNGITGEFHSITYAFIMTQYE